MKKIFSFLLGISIIVLSAGSCTFAYTQEQRDAYQWAYKYHITTQPTIEAANLNGNITRQAFAKMVVNYLENAIGVEGNNSNLCSFLDESKITNDLKTYTKKVCNYKIMGKNNSLFKPTDPVDRAQLGTVFSRILWGDKYNVDGKGYYIYHLNALKDYGVMNKINNPKAYAKRGDVMIMLKRIYEKFGSDININGNKIHNNTNYIGDTNYVSTDVDNNIDWTILNNTEDYDNSNDSMEENYVPYPDTSIVYIGKNGTAYTYDSEFINLLIKTANAKGESDLSDFLEVELDFIENGLEMLDFDEDEFAEELGIDLDNLDRENMTEKEKEELADKFGIWVNNLVNENKNNNNRFIRDLKKVVDKINNDDKFGLQEKYEETVNYIETSNSFLDTYGEAAIDLVRASIMMEEGDDNDEIMEHAFGLMGLMFAFNSSVEEYQSYINNWGINTVRLLGGELVE